MNDSHPPLKYTAKEAIDIARGRYPGQDVGVGFAAEHGRVFVDVAGHRFYGSTFNECLTLAQKALS